MAILLKMNHSREGILTLPKNFAGNNLSNESVETKTISIQFSGLDQNRANYPISFSRQLEVGPENSRKES